MKDPFISIVVPAFNEAERFTQTLPVLLDYLNTFNPDSELIVVDDGSIDDTAGVAARCFARELRLSTLVISLDTNRGKGCAVRTGLLAAKGSIGVFLDADLSTPMGELPKIVQPIVRGEVDVAFGSRALNRKLIGTHQRWQREQGGRVFNTIVKAATGLPFSDTQCGFKAFKMDVCRPLVEGAIVDRFAFDVELLYLAHKAGLRLLECPVRWDHNQGSKVNVLRDSTRMFVEVIGIRNAYRRGHYTRVIEQISNVCISA